MLELFILHEKFRGIQHASGLRRVGPAFLALLQSCSEFTCCVRSAEQDPKPLYQKRAGRTNSWWFPLNPPNLRFIQLNRTAARTHSSGLNRRSHVGRSHPQTSLLENLVIHKDAGAAKPVISGVPYERAIRRMDADVGTERDILDRCETYARTHLHPTQLMLKC